MSRPPAPFIPSAVQGIMVAVTERHRVFVRDLHAHGARLGELQMVRLRGAAATHEAGLSGDKRQVVAIPNACFLWQEERRFRRGASNGPQSVFEHRRQSFRGLDTLDPANTREGREIARPEGIHGVKAREFLHLLAGRGDERLDAIYVQRALIAEHERVACGWVWQFVARLRDLGLVAVIQSEPERIAERGQRPLRRIRFSRFDCDLVRHFGLCGSPQPRANPFSDRKRVSGADRNAHLSRVEADGLAALRVRPQAIGGLGLSVPILEAEDSVGLGDDVPAFDIGDGGSVEFAGLDMPVVEFGA